MLVEDEEVIDSTSEPSSSGSESEGAPYVRPSMVDVSSRGAFDAYFAQASRSHKTSSNVFSELVSPLSAEEFTQKLKSFNDNQGKASQDVVQRLEEGHDLSMPQYLLELTTGFNLAFYGLGSKRKTLNRLALKCAKHGHVVIVYGFAPSFNLNALLAGIERTLALDQVPMLSSSTDGRIQRILSSLTRDKTRHKGRRTLFIIFHNLDVFLQRFPKSSPFLARLSSCSSINFATSTDKISSSTYIQISDFISSKRALSTAHNSKGSLWLWHDLTTMQPYDFELSHADRTSYLISTSKDASGGLGAPGAQRSDAINERAAYHVLASVTEKAKKLFKLLGLKQLDNMQAPAPTQSSQPDEQNSAISYDLLFSLARDNFLATNDTALRALLSEFRDHRLVVGAADRKSTRLNSSHSGESRMPSSA